MLLNSQLKFNIKIVLSRSMSKEAKEKEESQVVHQRIKCAHLHGEKGRFKNDDSNARLYDSQPVAL